MGKLMHDFFCTNPDDMNYKELAEKVRYFKENEKGIETMCKVMEDMRRSVAEETAWNTKVESVLRWISMGVDFGKIAKGEGLSLEDVEKIADMQKE